MIYNKVIIFAVCIGSSLRSVRILSKNMEIDFIYIYVLSGESTRIDVVNNNNLDATVCFLSLARYV
jgi:hypothetical protein